MNKIKIPKATVFFGSKGSSLLKVKDKDLAPSMARKLLEPNVKFLRQTHSNVGFIVDKNFEPLSKEGDFLVTNQASVGVGVKTADCTPIIFYDSNKQAVGAAHAGWQGTTKNIAAKIVQSMQSNFGCKPKDIFVWIGPSAKTCCYKVGPEFGQNLDRKFSKQTLIKKENRPYFDQQTYNKLVLLEAGVIEKNINQGFNECTICNNNYGSFRREGENAPLQISYIMLD